MTEQATIKYRIEEIALDTAHLDYNPGPFFLDQEVDNINYIMTSISVNNDFLLKDIFKQGDGAFKKQLITTVDNTTNLCYLVENHLKELNKDRINILLLSESCFPLSDEVVEDIKNIQKLGLIEEVGINCPVKIDDTMKKLVEDGLIKYIALPMSPLTYNNPMVNWARNNKITVIGLNPFGGELSAARNIKAFTVPYLLRFAATNSDIVVLSGRDLIKADTEANYLASLIGKDSSGMYVLKKSTSNQVKEIKKFTYSSVQLKDDILVPYEEPETPEEIAGTVVTFGDYDKNLNVINARLKALEERLENENKSELTVAESLTQMLGTLDWSNYDEATGFAFARYKVLNYLELLFDRKIYSYDYNKIGKSIFNIKISKPMKVTGMLWWLKVEKEQDFIYTLAGNVSDGFIVLSDREEADYSNETDYVVDDDDETEQASENNQNVESEANKTL
jgi:hypothetical protein